MNVSDILGAATLASVLIGLGITFYKGADIIHNKSIKGAMDERDFKEAVDNMRDCKVNIKSIGGMVSGMNTVVHDMDKYGSKGAQQEFKDIKKTLDNHSKRLIRIEAHVNGGLDKVPPDEL